ncbi:hypothetical protein MNB_SUP05-10-683 [hydrothermal vent metagenome]|uniref:Uncharacterized protein n=1 Tax=hydrothermal vent metagenome TaxID=652676 RepID=A0A1W1D669_9ZZZZ
MNYSKSTTLGLSNVESKKIYPIYSGFCGFAWAIVASKGFFVTQQF